MKKPSAEFAMRYNWIILFGIAAMIVGCSQTASAPPINDDSAESSSTKKVSSSSKKATSSSSAADKLDEDCAGEPGNAWDGTTAKDFACGAGTKLSPYIILTAEQLAKLSFIVGANETEYQGKYYKLGADIVLNEGKIIDDKGALVADSTKLHKWTPIGNSSIAFTGNFDGDGHTVSGMFINTTSTHNGLFGNSSGTVQNLTVENSWVSGGKYTAGAVGYNVGTIENISNSASITATDECAGGIVGNSTYKVYNSYSTIKNVANKGFISGKNNVGGIAGCAKAVVVDNAENTALIEGIGYVGGIIGGIGSSSENEMKNLKNTGNINGSHFVGGISGHCGGNTTVSSKTSSYSCLKEYGGSCGTLQVANNKGKITGLRYVGGIIGEVCHGTISELSNSGDVIGEGGTGGIVSSMSYTKTTAVYNTGNIYGKDYVGGIIGYNNEGVTSAAYSTGKVDGDSLVGLMIGYNYNTTMADYYYLEQGEQEPFGLNNGGGVATPKTSEEMKSEEFAELLGEEFVYDPELNDGYPILKWEEE